MLQSASRHGILLTGLFAAVGFLFVPPHIAGQQQPAGDSPKDPVFRADTRLVVLHATVADRRGRLMPNLGQTAFKVLEDGVQQPIKLFRREDVPVSLGLIVDNSGSMRDKRQKVESAALAMIKASNPQDEVFIVNFNDEAFRDVDFTGDVKKMQEGLSRIDARGGTAMRDALAASIDYVRAKGKNDKKVLVVITDGNDTASTAGNSLEKLVQTAHQNQDVLLYMIGLLNDEDKREAKKAKRALEALAKASGGASAFPETASDVEQVTISIAGEIRNQYTIGYTPTRPELDGSFRSVKVEVDGPNKPVARTRSGYYATEGEQKPSAAAVSRSSMVTP